MNAALALLPRICVNVRGGREGGHECVWRLYGMESVVKDNGEGKEVGHHQLQLHNSVYNLLEFIDLMLKAISPQCPKA